MLRPHHTLTPPLHRLLPPAPRDAPAARSGRRGRAAPDYVRMLRILGTGDHITDGLETSATTQAKSLEHKPPAAVSPSNATAPLFQWNRAESAPGIRKFPFG